MLLKTTRFGRFAPQHIELMSKDQDFGLQRGPRPEQSDQAHQINLQRSPIATIINQFAGAVSRFGFSVGTGRSDLRSLASQIRFALGAGKKSGRKIVAVLTQINILPRYPP